MSTTALVFNPPGYDTMSRSRSALRILRRSTREHCITHKKTYRTPRKARIALDTLQREELRRQTALNQSARVERKPYQCEHCGLYHLTSRS